MQLDTKINIAIGLLGVIIILLIIKMTRKSEGFAQCASCAAKLEGANCDLIAAKGLREKCKAGKLTDQDRMVLDLYMSATPDMRVKCRDIAPCEDDSTSSQTIQTIASTI